MDARLKSSLLWGLVGVFTFLVAHQAYVLVFGPLGLGWVMTIAFAVGVGVLVTAVTYATEPRIAAKGRT